MYNEYIEYNDECFDYRNFELLGERWIRFEGDFKSDNKDGIGTLYLSNDEKFIGKFKDDFIHG